MKQTEHFKILGKKYQRNLVHKTNIVYFIYNGKNFEIEVLYVKPFNRYAFVQKWNTTRIEFQEIMEEMGLSTKERQEEFLTALNKYSKLGPMKEIDVR